MLLPCPWWLVKGINFGPCTGWKGPRPNRIGDTPLVLRPRWTALTRPNFECGIVCVNDIALVTTGSSLTGASRPWGAAFASRTAVGGITQFAPPPSDPSWGATVSCASPPITPKPGARLPAHHPYSPCGNSLGLRTRKPQGPGAKATTSRGRPSPSIREQQLSCAFKPEPGAKHLVAIASPDVGKQKTVSGRIGPPRGILNARVGVLPRTSPLHFSLTFLLLTWPARRSWLAGGAPPPHLLPLFLLPLLHPSLYRG